MSLDLSKLAEWRGSHGDGAAWLYLLAVAVSAVDPKDPSTEWLLTNEGRPWNNNAAATLLNCSATTFAKWRRALAKAGIIRVQYVRRGSRWYTLRVRNLAFILALNPGPEAELPRSAVGGVVVN